MSDVHALLDEATRRPVTHPDPVGAVHARVRRRAARRRAAVAAGTSSALVATGLVWVNRPSGRALPPTASVSPTAARTPSPLASPTAPSWEWRLRPTAAGAELPDDFRAAYQGVRDYVIEHPEVFAYFDHMVVDTDWTLLVGLGRDADPGVWEARLRRLTGDARLDLVHCPRTTQTYDQLHDEVSSATWPSGNTVSAPVDLIQEPVPGGPCRVVVELVGDGDVELDRAFAREQWGEHVVVVGTAEPVMIGSAEPSTITVR